MKKNIHIEPKTTYNGQQMKDTNSYVEHKASYTVKLNEKALEVIKYMDYQVMNNGIDGWLSNRGYEKLNEFIRVLYKRNSEIDQEVASIFINATIAGLGLFQHKDKLVFPEIKEMLYEYQNELHRCGEQYKEVAREFMESYGLEN